MKTIVGPEPFPSLCSSCRHSTIITMNDNSMIIHCAEIGRILQGKLVTKCSAYASKGYRERWELELESWYYISENDKGIKSGFYPPYSKPGRKEQQRLAGFLGDEKTRGDG